MPKIITYGCSFTQGEGFSDCLVGKDLLRAKGSSQYAWPAVLGDLMGYSIENNGMSGSSNKMFSHMALERKWSQTDVAIFMWTYWHRTTIIENLDKTRFDIIPGNMYEFKNFTNEQILQIKAYYNHVYHPFDMFYDNMRDINLVKYHLDSIGVKNFHYHLAPIPHEEKGTGLIKTKKISIDLPSWSKVDFKHAVFDKVDLADDKKHPGRKSQAIMANSIYEDLTGKI